jgi:hypothetical protein
MSQILRGIIAIGVVAVLLAGCSSTNEPNAATEPNVTSDKNGASIMVAPNCSTDCITIGSNVYYPVTGTQTVTWGGPQNNNSNKTLTYEYYNTETHFVIRMKSTNAISDVIVNTVSTGLQAAAGAWVTYSVPLSSGWQPCDAISRYVQVAGNGPQYAFTASYNLVGVCAGCVTGFTGTAISCGSSREAVYEFTSEDGEDYFKIQGGLTNFTGSDAVVTVTGGTTTVTQSTPGGSSNRIIKVEGSSAACEKITIRITWNSTNTGGIITGDWSVKDENSIAIAPGVAGLTCN